MMGRTSAHGRRRRSFGRGSAIKFLIFAILTISLTLYMAFAIVGSDLHPTYRVAATFDDVSGLGAGDLVKVAGTPVGRVTGVRIVDGKAVVGMDVNRNIRIPVDSRAAIRWRNLIGQREVYLEPGTSNAVLHDGGHVSQTQSAVDLGEVINSLGPLTGSLDPNEINQILQSFAVALNGNEGNITQITTNLSTLLQVFGSRSDTIHQMIGNYKTVTDAVAARDQQIAETVQNLQKLTRAFADNRAVIDGAAVQLSGLTANLNTVLGGAGPQLGSVIEGTASLLEVAHRNVSQLSGLLRGLPAALQALLTTLDGGHFVRGTVLCIDYLQTDVCRFPMTLPPPPQVKGGSGSGSTRPLTSAEQTSFQRMASLFLLGTQVKGQ
jgi:phospholipid/cholesterol/gamma-HCH transport system substrate-binding protein